MKINDINIILGQYKIATYFGFPLVSEILTPRWKENCFKFYPVVIFFTYFAFTVDCLTKRAEFYGPFFAPMQCLNDVLQMFSEIFFLSVCLLWPTKRLRKWHSFWSNLKALDKSLRKLGFENKQNSLVCGTITSVCFAAVFCVQIWEILNWYNVGRWMIIYSYMNFRIAMYYELFTTILICQITTMFKVRFDFLKAYLRKVASKKQILWDVSQNEALFTVRQLREICRIYASVYSLIKTFNDVLGWHILFIIKSTILTILSSVNFGVTVVKVDVFVEEHISMDLILINVAYSTVLLAFTVGIILFCDSAEKSGRSVSEQCVLLQQDMPQSSVRKELKFLGQFTNRLTPEFTSAGFFRISQSIFMSFFSTVATYVIISLQFNSM